MIFQNSNIEIFTFKFYGMFYLVMDGNHPYRYIDAIDSQKHILLLYEEPEYAKILEFRFIYNGIMNNQPSIYAMHDDVKLIEEEMDSFGIDVSSAKKRGLLYVYNIPDPRDHPDGFMKGSETILSTITNGLSNYRLVSRLISSIDNIAASTANIILEQTYHKLFSALNCTLLCPYNISEIPYHIQKEWFRNILANHHGVIFAPKLDSGIAFDMCK